MQSYALIGHPLGHSFFPRIHARLFARGTSMRADPDRHVRLKIWPRRCRRYAGICGAFNANRFYTNARSSR